MSRKRKNGVQRRLALDLGVSQPQISKLIRRGMPKTVEKTRAWRAQNLDLVRCHAEARKRADRGQNSPSPLYDMLSVAYVPAIPAIVVNLALPVLDASIAFSCVCSVLAETTGDEDLHMVPSLTDAVRADVERHAAALRAEHGAEDSR